MKTFRKLEMYKIAIMITFFLKISGVTLSKVLIILLEFDIHQNIGLTNVMFNVLLKL